MRQAALMKHRKLSIPFWKAFTCLVVVLLLLDSVGATSGWEYYPASYAWGFQNNCYFSFESAMNFTDIPYQGLLNDNSLVGYWNTNEESGSIVHDSSGNGFNGTLSSIAPTWAAGKYGNALNFSGSNQFVDLGKSPLLNPTSALTLSVWVNLSSSPNGYQRILTRRDGSGVNVSCYSLELSASGLKPVFWVSDGNTIHSVTSNTSLQPNRFYHIVAVYDGSNGLIYVDGKLDSVSSFGNFPINTVSTNTYLARDKGGYTSIFFKGVVDDIRIYNRALSANDVASLYLQPDPTYLVNYYNYQDSATNNTMLIHIDDPDANSNNLTLVTCTDFFTGNRLAFNANNSATLNLWSNLGRPVFTTGVWNSQNYTTTLTLDASRTGELSWSPPPSPSASNLSTNSTIAGSNAMFSVLWSDNQTLFAGGYVFSTNNTGQWVNASWVPFSSDSGWGNATLTLNSTVGAVVGFRQFANDSLNLWGDSGIYAITTTNDTATPTPSSAPTASPTSIPVPSQSPEQTNSPSPTPISQQETNQFPTQTVAIAVIAVATLIAVFALAFKKGYITIETVDEENPEETSDDYTI